MLVPAAVLVLVILGAIAVDFSVAFLGQRELTSAAAAAANDASSAIAEGPFYQGSGGASEDVVVDERRAARVVDQALVARAPRGVSVDGVSVDSGGGQVCVVIRGRVDYVFAKAIPGMSEGAALQGRSTATAVTGAAGTPVAPRPPC